MQWHKAVPRLRVAIAVSVALAAGLVVAAGTPVAASAQPAPRQGDCLTASPPSCYAPRQFRTAYGVQPLLNRGVDGRGETVSMIVFTAGPTPSPPQVTDIRQDLATFDGLFDLPPARLQVVTSLAGASAPWEAGTLGEHFFSRAQVAEMRGLLGQAAARHVTVVAASGDSGVLSDVYRFGVAAVKEVSLPASDPLALAVGGTALTAERQIGSYVGERVWNQTVGGGSFASAGGFSGIFDHPAYQDGVSGTEAARGVPDVAGDADGQTGMALAVEAGGGSYDLRSAGGTSAATPLWGGLLALADQLAGHDLGFVNPALYMIAHSPMYGRAFHDVTTGNNTVTGNGVTYTGYQAEPGWDPVTGLGSPNAAVLLPLLRRTTRPTHGVTTRG